MSDFKAKTASNSISAGAPPRTRWGAYGAPQTPYLHLSGPSSKGRVGTEEGSGRLARYLSPGAR